MQLDCSGKNNVQMSAFKHNCFRIV